METLVQVLIEFDKEAFQSLSVKDKRLLIASYINQLAEDDMLDFEEIEGTKQS